MSLTPPTPEELQEFRARSDERRRRGVIGVVGSAIAVLIAVVVIGWITDSQGSTTDMVFPLGTLTTIDGAQFDLVSLRGEPAVVNFFASWCAPCRAEMPDFEEVHQQRRDEVRFVGINAGETSTDDALDLIDTTGVSYMILMGAEGTMVEDLGGIGMPFTLFVTADGTVVDTHVGPLKADALHSKIDDLLDR
jgi:thiol-disulfide isomerase/thioredoxin